MHRSKTVLIRALTRSEVLRCSRLYVCLSVCMSARISQNRHVQTSRNFWYVLPEDVVWSSADCQCNTIVLPVLWITSCFHTMAQMQKRPIGELFTVTGHVAPGAKSALDDCFVYVFIRVTFFTFLTFTNIFYFNKMLSNWHADTENSNEICTFEKLQRNNIFLL